MVVLCVLIPELLTGDQEGLRKAGREAEKHNMRRLDPRGESSSRRSFCRTEMQSRHVCTHYFHAVRRGYTEEGNGLRLDSYDYERQS